MSQINRNMVRRVKTPRENCRPVLSKILQVHETGWWIQKNQIKNGKKGSLLNFFFNNGRQWLHLQRLRERIHP